jgi:hypothetical protein
MKIIPVRKITITEAKRLGLTKNKNRGIILGGGSSNVGIITMGKIGEKKASKVEIHNQLTNERKTIFDKGKSIKFNGWDSDKINKNNK